MPSVMRLVDDPMKIPLRSKRITYLLDELCVELGFCLPPDERARLQNKPPESIDAFTDAIFRAEALDPLYAAHTKKWILTLAAHRAFHCSNRTRTKDAQCWN